MDKNIPAHPRRKKNYNNFLNLLVDYQNKNPEYNYSHVTLQKKAINLEIGVFNYALNMYKAHSTNKANSHFWNKSFEIYYSNRFITIYSNLNPESKIKNTSLIKKYFNNEFDECKLTHFTTQEIFPEKYEEMSKLYIKDVSNEPLKMEVEDGILQCRKCRSYKVTYYQLQTASGDESFTTYANCHNCGNKFKFR
jgi:DNA-directed RNA polymerase subunit M/transcription elongation factor TFIIS